MTISVVILNFKSPELLKLCLTAVQDTLAQDLPNQPREIIVVDSAREEATAELLAENFPAIKYWPRIENTGYAKGVNIGLRQAQGEYLLILNHDVVAQAGSLKTLLHFLQANPTVGMVGPKLLGFNRQPQISCFRFYRPWTIVYRRTFLGKLPWGKKALREFSMADQDQQTVLWPDWLQGSALLIRRSALQQVGLLDERFFMYFEDVDWAKRFWENGYKVAFFPKAIMFHYHGRGSRAGLDMFDIFLRREARWHLQSALKYFMKHGWRYRSGEEIFKSSWGRTSDVQ